MVHAFHHATPHHDQPTSPLSTRRSTMLRPCFFNFQSSLSFLTSPVWNTHRTPTMTGTELSKASPIATTMYREAGHTPPPILYPEAALKLPLTPEPHPPSARYPQHRVEIPQHGTIPAPLQMRLLFKHERLRSASVLDHRHSTSPRSQSVLSKSPRLLALALL